MRRSGNTILVTGGGTGIGREMARWWAQNGNTVIVAGRNAESLVESTAGEANIHAMTFDVSDPTQVGAFAAAVVERFPDLNVLVNNAGIMRFEDISGPRDLADAEALIQTNLLGPIRMTDALVAHLSAQPGAAIVNVTSGLAFVPMPRAATYSATKAALHSYTASLRAMLKGLVEVIEIAPPAVQTELTPGQSTHEHYMPLADFIAETMAQFEDEPTPPEVLTGNVGFLRDAERDGRFDQVLEITSQF